MRFEVFIAVKMLIVAQFVDSRNVGNHLQGVTTQKITNHIAMNYSHFWTYFVSLYQKT
jgi:hypothetical protein